MLKKLKMIGAALAIAAMPLSATATVVSIGDAGGQADFSPFASPLTLDASAVDTGAFDSTSKLFSFLGLGSGSESFSLINNGVSVVSIGNVVTAAKYSKAEITVAGTLIDLLAVPDMNILVNVAGAFTILTDFVVKPSAIGGSYDFTISAVPVPAAGFLLLGALGGLGLMRRRRKTA